LFFCFVDRLLQGVLLQGELLADPLLGLLDPADQAAEGGGLIIERETSCYTTPLQYRASLVSSYLLLYD